NLRLAVGRLVEHEIRILAAVGVVAHLGEQALAEPGALDGLEILLGDDAVGVDVDHLQRRGDAFEHGELFHGGSCGSWGHAFSANVCRAEGHCRSGTGPPAYPRAAGRARGRYATSASIAAMSSSERPKWWPISCSSTWVTILPRVSSCSAQ